MHNIFSEQRGAELLELVTMYLPALADVEIDGGEVLDVYFDAETSPLDALANFWTVVPRFVERDFALFQYESPLLSFIDTVGSSWGYAPDDFAVNQAAALAHVANHSATMFDGLIWFVEPVFDGDPQVDVIHIGPFTEDDVDFDWDDEIFNLPRVAVIPDPLKLIEFGGGVLVRPPIARPVQRAFLVREPELTAINLISDRPAKAIPKPDASVLQLWKEEHAKRTTQTTTNKKEIHHDSN